MAITESSFSRVFQRIGFIVLVVDTERADDLVAFFYRNADKGDLLIQFSPPGFGAIQKMRLLADFGNGYGVTCLNHLSGNPFPEFIPHPFNGCPGNAVRHFDGDFIGQGI